MIDVHVSLSEIRTVRVDNIDVIALNRPASANALTEALIDGLLVQLTSAASDDDVSGVVLTGTGKAFCAGGDLEMLRKWRGLDIMARSAAFRRSQRLVGALLEFPKPVIAAVNGPSAGAGFDLVMCCDLVVAAEAATFRTAFASVGLVPDLGGSWLLPQLVGLARARRLFMTGEVLDVVTAQDWGLVSNVVPADQLMDAAIDAAQGIVKASAQPALRELKKTLLEEVTTPLNSALERAAYIQAALMDTPEHITRTTGLLGQKNR